MAPAPERASRISPAEMVDEYLRAMRSTGYAPVTVGGRALHLRRFARWASANGITDWGELSERVLEEFRSWVANQPGADGKSLARSTIHHRLAAIRLVCAWAMRTRRAVGNPAVDWVLPRLPRHLPRGVLSRPEVERVLGQPDVATSLGLRDRAIMELMYSTGLRRGEVVALDLGDLLGDRRLVFVREGKGRRDRVVPIGDRALAWIARYLREVRKARFPWASCTALFLNAKGTRIRPPKLTERFHAYVVRSGVGKPGSCHIFRHTMATLMHDNGADIRDLQEILGHVELATTQIYTHVSVERLRAVHARTHPAEIELRGSGDGR